MNYWERKNKFDLKHFGNNRKNSTKINYSEIINGAVSIFKSILDIVKNFKNIDNNINRIKDTLK